VSGVDDELSASGVADAIDEPEPILFQNFEVLLVISLPRVSDNQLYPTYV
jgi:hypothetical protein